VRSHVRFVAFVPLRFWEGANPSAEEQEEALEDGAEQKIDVVHTFRLEKTAFDKKAYMTYLKVRHCLLINY
jgi:hypothetical protein